MRVRQLAGVLLVWAATTLLVSVAAGTKAEPLSQHSDAVMRGGAVFMSNCAACHGTQGLGGVGRGVERGPRITGLPLAYVDLMVRTGRMPIAAKELGVVVERLEDDDREALLVFLAEVFGLEGQIPSVESGDPMRGQELFVRNCAACHGAHTTGGIVGGGVRAPAIGVTDPVAVAEAIRVGPREMPAFGDDVLDGQQVDDVIAYLQGVVEAPKTLAGLSEINDVVAAIAALGLTAAVLLVVRRLGSESPRDDREDDPTAPGGGTWT